MKTSLLINYIQDQLDYISSIVLSISKDSDIEYLHGFRVAIRRTRSLLKLFFPNEQIINQELKKIVQKTNTLRELDIFINSLDKELYPKLYKSIFQARTSFFQTIWTEKFITNTIKKLEIIKINLQEIKSSYTKKTYIKTAHSHYKKSIKKFESILSSDNEHKLHKIRIHFKVSKYALEFLHKTKLSKEKKRIKKCKSTQDLFGDIQDKTNQIDWLKNFCESLHNSKECEKLINIKRDELKKLKDMANKRA